MSEITATSELNFAFFALGSFLNFNPLLTGFGGLTTSPVKWQNKVILQV